MHKDRGLIVFFVPPKKIVNGGVMSIFSQCKESRRFNNIHNSDVIVCTYPGYDTYVKNDLFNNNEKVYSFDEVINKWKKLSRILLHIPETSLVLVADSLNHKYKEYLNRINYIHINVMTQNINLMRTPLEFSELLRITSNITQTTAHEKYTTQELSNLYHTPVHHLSVFIDKSQYSRSSFLEKKNLILYSPDQHPYKSRIVDSLNTIEGFETREIKDLSYNQYKDLIRQAKFCITFGEGLDGYFIESYLSGSVGISIYNDRFFSNPKFLELPSVFKDYQAMSRTIKKTILSLNDPKKFDDCVSRGNSLLEKIYDYKLYIKNLEEFYRGDYDIVPEKNMPQELIATILDSRERALETLAATQELLDKEKINKNKIQSEKNKIQSELANVMNSKSWKITEPLRTLSTTIRRFL